VRRAVDREFKQSAETIVLGFSIAASDLDRTAQRDERN